LKDFRQYDKMAESILPAYPSGRRNMTVRMPFPGRGVDENSTEETEE